MEGNVPDDACRGRSLTIGLTSNALTQRWGYSNFRVRGMVTRDGFAAEMMGFVLILGEACHQCGSPNAESGSGDMKAAVGKGVMFVGFGLGELS